MYIAKCENTVAAGSRVLQDIADLETRFHQAISIDIDELYTEFLSQIIEDFFVDDGDASGARKGEGQSDFRGQVQQIFSAVGIRFNEVGELRYVGRAGECASMLSSMRSKVEAAIKEAESKLETAKKDEEKFKRDIATAIISQPGAVSPRSAPQIIQQVLGPAGLRGAPEAVKVTHKMSEQSLDEIQEDDESAV